MKLSVGYFSPDEYDCISEIIEDNRNAIDEIYFSFAEEPGGRSAVAPLSRKDHEEKKALQLEELTYISKELKVKTALLFNANCYGGDAISVALEKRVIDKISFLKKELDLNSVTTTSPFIAKIIKREFKDTIKIRASVNMRTGTIKAMEYLTDFDGFYMQREFNRNFERIRLLKDWCDKNGKTLHFLANSGCLKECSFQTFHDNTVAHEEEIIKNNNVKLKYPSPCWDFMEALDPVERAARILQNTWVRPEDLVHYEPYFENAKIATRIHSNPRLVINSYASGKVAGNIFDITEPSYSMLFGNYILDSRMMPDDWFEKVTNCDKMCHKCSYCRNVAEKALTDISKYI